MINNPELINKVISKIKSLTYEQITEVIRKVDMEEDIKRKNICEHCVEYNGDGMEETGGLDYYSCELMNKKDLKKYGSYSSLENQVDEEECTYPLGEKCKYKERLEK